MILRAPNVPDDNFPILKLVLIDGDYSLCRMKTSPPLKIGFCRGHTLYAIIHRARETQIQRTVIGSTNDILCTS